VQSGSEPFGLLGTTNAIKADLRGHGRGHGAHCACRPSGVHGMAHVSTLDARLHVLRGNIPGYCLPSLRVCVGPTRMSGPLRGGGVCDIWPSLELGP